MKNISVMSFACKTLPRLSIGLVTHPMITYFKKEAPVPYNLSTVRTWLLPTATKIRELADALPQVWLDGYQSVIYVHLQSDILLPLWIVTYWELAMEVHDSQAAWKWSIIRLEQQEQSLKNSSWVLQAREHMMRLPWTGCMEDIQDGCDLALLATYFRTNGSVAGCSM